MAVSHGRNRNKGLKLPNDQTDERNIVDWLEDNGFHRLVSIYALTIDEMRYGHGLCYCVGEHTDQYATWWVNVGDGNGNAVSVRTADSRKLKSQGYDLYSCTIAKNGSPSRESDWKEVRALIYDMVGK